VFLSVFIMGILLSVMATYFAVNKYLRMEADKMYYI
jgi:cell division transport system permease protein